MKRRNLDEIKVGQEIILHDNVHGDRYHTLGKITNIQCCNRTDSKDKIIAYIITDNCYRIEII